MILVLGARGGEFVSLSTLPVLFVLKPKVEFSSSLPCPRDSLSEWSRRQIRNLLGSARRVRIPDEIRTRDLLLRRETRYPLFFFFFFFF